MRPKKCDADEAGNKTQRALHAAAENCLGTLVSGNSRRAETARKTIRGGGAVGGAFSFECGGWRRYSSRVSVAAGETSESPLGFSTYGLPQTRVTQLETQWAEQIKRILTQ
jgi:hypothetical protein